ncbi:FHA domain-containing protein [Patulibacter sp. NPDC049589]|uniref:FHA domain-containing protein n=1 Tax=Patulibacter sp. NPDC049589 TaxID=3154731 RepID=UPI00343651F7
MTFGPGAPAARTARLHRLDEGGLRRLEDAGVQRPVVVFGPQDGPLHAIWLPGSGRLQIGRSPDSGIPLTWDDEVSRLHAILEILGDEVVLHDPGYSANGTLVDGRRVRGSVRLRDRAAIRVGRSRLTYRGPDHRAPTTRVVRDHRITVTPAQRRVLAALCAPLLTAEPAAALPSNADIAADIGLSEETVRTHLKTLYRQLPGPPRPGRRATLARWAAAEGLLTEDG